MLAFLDIFCFVFHTSIILFNLFGWIWKKTRFANLLLLSATAFSWLVLGIWFGIGYCPLVDWHWAIRRKLGYHDVSDSYIKFLLDHLTGIEFDIALVEFFTGFIFACLFFVSLFLNSRDWRRDSRKS